MNRRRIAVTKRRTPNCSSARRNRARCQAKKIFNFRLTTSAPLLKVYSLRNRLRHAHADTSRAGLAHRDALDASPSRIPVLVGGCGSGRTTLLHQLRDRARPRPRRSIIDVERTATTPERFLRAVAAASPFPVERAPRRPAPAPRSTRRSTFLRARARGSGEPATFLLDEFLELRTFESFPGLRRVLHDFVDGLAASGNRFVLTSRYVGADAAAAARPLGAVRSHPHAGADRRGHARYPRPGGRAGRCATTPNTSRAPCRRWPTAGPSYVRALADELAAMREHGGRGRSDADQRAGRAARARRPAGEAVRLLLRAAPAPRARLRRAQGDPRDPRRRRRPDADRDLPAPAAHARARRRTICRGSRTSTWSPRGRSATASPIRCCASGCGCTAAPTRADRRRSRARSAPLRAAAPAAAAGTARAARSRVRDGRRPAAGSGIIEID